MNFWKNRPLIICMTLIVVLFVLMLTTANTDSEKGPVSLAARLIEPVQELFYNITEGIGSVFEKRAALAELSEENEKLKERVAELESQLQDYYNIYNQNERLKEILNFIDKIGEHESLTASVIGKAPGAWFDEFTINAGSDDGLATGMIVYSADGLVGRMVYTAESYSRVISIVHEDSGVAVMIERTRDNGVLKYDSAAGVLKIYYMADEADVLPGDKVITSGLGGIYPKGIEVGVVSEVSTNTAKEKVVAVKSPVDFDHLEEVVVVKYLFEEVD